MGYSLLELERRHMPFEKDLFISYAHIDDRPLAGQDRGWITRFHRDLEDRLAMRLGQDPRIWRDERLHGNDVFSDEIVSQLPKTALMVSIVSPRYVKSDWCKREVTEFCRAAERSGGIKVENKCRVVKVVKTPVGLTGLPPVMQETLGYDFFERDGNTPIEIDPAYGADMVPLFNRRMAKLAAELAETLEIISAKTATEGDALQTDCAQPAKPVIYLAECGFDRGTDREMIETELRSHGYTVLPDIEMPGREDQYISEVRSGLLRSQLAIHLVGADYGMVPYGPTGKSAPVLTNEIATEMSKSAGLPRIIWLSPNVKPANAEQQRFVEMLQTDAHSQLGADLVIGHIETVKATIHATLRKLEQPKSASASSAEATPAGTLTYLICDERDKEAIKPLRRLLNSLGHQVRLPLFAADAGTVRQHHQELLAECDLVIHFYGSGDERWKTTVETDLWKLKSFRGAKPMPKRCTYIAQPETADKRDMIEFLEPGMLDGTGDFPEAQIRDYLKR